MALGMPDVSKVTAEFREHTKAIVSLLTEVRDLLRIAVEHDGAIVPPKPLPADCCEHGASCTRSTR